MKNLEVQNSTEPTTFGKPVLPEVFTSTGHKIEYDLGQIVYLKTDNEQHGRMVTQITLRPNKSVMYALAFGSGETWHYSIEISNERDIIKATT
jgi:hypothetical protein